MKKYEVDLHMGLNPLNPSNINLQYDSKVVIYTEHENKKPHTHTSKRIEYNNNN